MLLLHTLTLLDRYKVPPRTLVTLIHQCKTEAEFESRINHIVKDLAKFNHEWRLAGVNQSKQAIWERLLNTYFYEDITSKIASTLHYGRDDINQNIDGCTNVVRQVAAGLSLSELVYGQNLVSNIQKLTEGTILNSRKEYSATFSVRMADTNIQTALASSTINHSIVIDNPDKALTNVSASEVRCILSDIYETKSLYYINSELNSMRQYSIYESFVKAYFNHQMTELNEELRGYVTIRMEDTVHKKFTKLDDIMRVVLNDFILPGITLDNLYELQKVVAIFVEKEKVTSAAPAFKQKLIPNADKKNVKGNFLNQYTFSGDVAAKSFHQLISAMIALSKLYRYIVVAGKQPYDISIDTFLYDDPSLKFSSLKDLIDYSGVYSEARAKYGITEDLTELVAIRKPLNSATDILINRKEIALHPLLRTTEGLLNGDTREIHLGLHLPHFDIFNAIRLLEEGKNPVYSLFDAEEVFDPDFIVDDASDYFTELFGPAVAQHMRFSMTPSMLQDLYDVSEGELRTFLHDIAFSGIEKQERIFSALESFLEDCSEMLIGYKARYAGCSVSQVELSTVVLRSDLFKGLRSDIRDYDKPERIAAILLGRYDEEITEADMVAFFDDEKYENLSVSRLVPLIRKNIFLEIGTIYKNADLYLYNLQDVGKQMCLTDGALLKVINNVTDVVDRERFLKRHEGIRKNAQGYFVDDEGNLRYSRTRNNKTGFLHSQGVYVFLDGETEPWE